ncbi:MAG: hypothetical protein MK116_03915 [Phycisphaerales bacterium]|nr:hypothetical protein [Phycisphaerales bacterium]
MTFGELLLTVGLPTLVGAILIVPAWVIPRIRKTAGIAGSALGVALGLGVAIAFMTVADIPSLPPTQKWHMLPIIACGVTVLCPVVAMVDGSGELGRWLIGIASGAIIGWLAVFPNMDLFMRILLGVYVAMTFMVLSWGSHRRRGLTLNLAFTIVFTGLTLLCMKAHFITLTLIAAALSSISFVAFLSALVAAIWTRDEDGKKRFIKIGWGGAFAIAALIPMVTFCGWAYNTGDVQWVHWLLVAVAPVMLLFGELPGLSHNNRLSGFVVRIALVTAPVVIGLTLLYSGVGLDVDHADDEYNIEYFEEHMEP